VVGSIDPKETLMPTISTFMGITITMYFDDHAPPHFHARAAEHGAKVRIDELEVIESDLRRRELRLVLAWADRSRETLAFGSHPRFDQHAEELDANWQRAREGVTLEAIEPLR
jgi:Domain of unknown function (DUF4160)